MGWVEYTVLVLHACISLTARRRRPPVLLLTISMYSVSEGQVRLSRQNRSMPCPRWRLISSSGIRLDHHDSERTIKDFEKFRVLKTF